MSYQALYRTWRPQSFADFIGQPHVRQTLMNALQSGKIAHAYLFCGPRGTGKTSAAKLFAKAVNCLAPHGVEPCNECAACVSITRGNNVDVEEIDAASNRGVDEIRELRDKVHYLPTSVRKKVYIVDEVHMLTTEAFNALLKTLEEPPAHVLFLLATTEPHKLPNTIVSRCQRFDFHRIATETIVERLQEVVRHQGWSAQESALWKLAEAADGGLRDALGLLEQAAAFGQGEIGDEVVASVVGGVDTAALLALVSDLAATQHLDALRRLAAWYAAGKDATRIVHDLLQVLRDLFIVKLSPTDDALGGKPIAPYRAVAESKRVTSEWLLTAVHKLGELYTQLRYLDQPRLALEAALLGMVLPSAPTLAQQPAVQMAPQVASQAPATPPVVETSASGSAVPTASAHEAVASPGGRGQAQRPQAARATRRAAGPDRKRETLARLYAERSADVEAMVRERWPDVLHKVKADRIQTHAWLTHGEIAFATEHAVVMSFVSRIHREAVMKPADRQTIEAAFQVILERDMQLFALLKADWDEYLASLTQAPEPQSETATEPDLVGLAVQLFGPDKVIAEDEGSTE
ncbi:DNA polymerase III, subunit gamma and tau [Alicyclobacillus hesperidum subsp. aegles]|uniref:DNA polymerase III subunit gamma/tau n=1 Tax=Alicyclobacillus hesperidum TaxID=89784 RepID=UPI00222DCE8F|nr:DNA polymerase III subunit gamma/tau [Alicyclobacillus hesperidum]GLG02442.1 DNA polymerase III, subunit gamma and tau [Alicyclobacillus hesperidum subsp. aegles]